MEGYGVSQEDKNKIRTKFKVTTTEVQHNVETLKKWAQNKSHLPRDSQDEGFLNIMLLRSKFDNDVAKTNIENYFKCMNKYPEIFGKLGNFKPSEEVGIAIASPQLTPDLERIGILKIIPKNMNNKKFNINQMILVTVTTGIIMYNNDYVPSVRFLLDFEGFTMLDLFRVNVKDLFKLIYICEKILRIRISGIELLNAPRITSMLLGIAKMVLKPKMFSRVSTHDDLCSLYKNIPKSCLPSDYGGHLDSTDKLIELWDVIIEENKPFFQKVANCFKHNSKNSEAEVATC